MRFIRVQSRVALRTKNSLICRNVSLIQSQVRYSKANKFLHIFWHPLILRQQQAERHSSTTDQEQIAHHRVRILDLGASVRFYVDVPQSILAHQSVAQYAEPCITKLTKRDWNFSNPFSLQQTQ